MLSDEYIAGFLDADGYVALAKCGSTNEVWRRRPEVSFSNCDKEILQRISETYPGGSWATKKPRSENHNVSYALRYRGEGAFDIMYGLIPHIQHAKKKMRMQLMIDNRDTLRSSYGVPYTKDMIKKKTKLVEQVMGIKMSGKGAY